MTSVSKNVHINQLDYIINTHSSRYHSTIKIKTVDAKSHTYINSSREINNKDPKFKIGDIVRLSEHKKCFCKRLRSRLV